MHRYTLDYSYKNLNKPLSHSNALWWLSRQIRAVGQRRLICFHTVSGIFPTTKQEVKCYHACAGGHRCSANTVTLRLNQVCLFSLLHVYETCNPVYVYGFDEGTGKQKEELTAEHYLHRKRRQYWSGIWSIQSCKSLNARLKTLSRWEIKIKCKRFPWTRFWRGLLKSISTCHEHKCHNNLGISNIYLSSSFSRGGIMIQHSTLSVIRCSG